MSRFKKITINKEISCYRQEGYQALLSVVVASLLLNSGIAEAATTYTMKDIGINPTAVNSTGQVLGSNYMLYNNGTLSSIRAMTSPAILTQGFDINTAGQVVGYGSSYGTSAFVRNSDGTFVNVGVGSDPNFRPATGTAINDAGQVAGRSVTLNTSLYPCAMHAFLGSISSPVITDLGSLGGEKTIANDINASGTIVGNSSVPTLGSLCPTVPEYHAFIFTATNGILDLHSPAMLGKFSAANKVNNTGLVVGNFANGLTVPDLSGYYPNGYPIRNAVIWNLTTGTYKSLGNSTMESSLLAVNDNGIAVGYERGIINSNSTLAGKAILVDVNGTSLIDLNTLVQGLPTGWSLTKAIDINNAGQIIALALDSAGYHGVLLTPTSTTTTPPPNAPSGLTGKVISDKQIDLSWLDNASNESSQILERCQGNGCTSFATIATLAPGVTSYSDSSLTASTQYSYRIKAQGSSGSSSYSATVSVTTLPPAVTPIPATPSNLNATATSRSRIVLSWTDNADNEQSFVVERCTGVGCTNFTPIATVAANGVSFNNSSLQRYTNYSYRVKAVNASGSSNYSNTDTARTFN